MLTVADLTRPQLRAFLRGQHLTLAVPPFVVRLRSPISIFADALRCLYGDYRLVDAAAFADFHIALEVGRGLRGVVGPGQSRFIFDGTQPFKPLPITQAYASFEWGLNWCVANHCHQYLVVHAAVVERDGRAAILAAPPGSGKSTLCAGLVNRGWRLFSDELALFDTSNGHLSAFPRPICLKNRSIEVIRSFAPAAHFGPVVRNTRKGDIAHMRPSRSDVDSASVGARPAWIIFPRFVTGIATQLRGKSKAQAGLALANNAFNFSTLGVKGFETINKVVNGSTAYELDYGNLDEAVELFDGLAADP